MTNDELINQYLAARALRWQASIDGIMQEAEAELIRELLKLQRELQKEIEQEVSKWGRASEWTTQMEEDVSSWVREALAGPAETITEFIYATSAGTATATLAEYNAMISFEGAATAVKLMEGLTQEQITEFFYEQPLGGKLLQEWVEESFTHEVQDALLSAIREGVLVGEGTEAIVDRVMTVSDIGFIRNRRDMGTLVRTYIQSANIGAQEAVYKKNEDVIKGYRRRETLDNRTCQTCALADGLVYKVGEERPSLPAHPRCRGLYLPVLKTWRELGIDIDELEEVARPWVMRDKQGRIIDNGFVKGSFEDFFKGLSEEKQALTSIGPVRSRLLRQGSIKWRDLIDKKTGLPHTLEELGFFTKGKPLEFADNPSTKKVMRNIDRAEVPIEKLSQYILNPSSDRGQHKFRVFTAAFDFSVNDADNLRSQLIERLPESFVLSSIETEYGEKVTVATPITGNNGHYEYVRATWIYHKDKPYIPRLVTVVLPNEKRNKRHE